jgi:methylmalonyl-CoA/ethylmalonyl-CoA epimerase
VATKATFDHVAVATLELTDGWQLFGCVLGGSWAYGGDSAGFWWGQLQFRSGPKIELLTPTGGPDAAFLERFLAARGAGPHHLNFIVGDIDETLARLRSVGIEPVGVSLANPVWKEAFVHPRDADGIVIQVAQQAGPPPEIPVPPQLLAPGAPSAFALVEHRVADLGAAVRLFAEVLDGEVVSRPGPAGRPVAELAWDNGARLRLIQDGTGSVGGLGSLTFGRDGGGFSAAERSRAADLAGRLAVSLQLAD